MNKLLVLLALVSYVYCFDIDEFRQQALKQHNQYRHLHGVQDLLLNDDISAIAQDFAKKLADWDRLDYSFNKYKGDQLGENAAFVYGYDAYTGSDATDMWYQGGARYNYADPGFSLDTGAFTQIIWKSTTDVGFGVAQAKDGKIYVVANYYPPGNLKSKIDFSKNVFPPRPRPEQPATIKQNARVNAVMRFLNNFE